MGQRTFFQRFGHHTYTDTNQRGVSRVYWLVASAASLFAGDYRCADDAALLVTVGASVSSYLLDQDAMRDRLLPPALAETQQATMRERCSRLE